jgi:Spy/CpxP family protein refolding chaperone
MKTFQRLFFAIATLLMFSQLAFAQSEMGEANARKEKIKKFVLEELQLTEEQKTKTKEVFEKYREEVKEIKGKEGEKKDKKAELKTQKDAFETELKAIFTPEQYAKYEAKRDEIKEKKKEAKGKGKGKNKKEGE